MSRDRAWIEVLTSPDCGLCRALLRRLTTAAPFFGMRVTVTDVGGDPALLDEYRERTPVIRNSRGRVLAEGDVSWGGIVLALVRGRFAAPSGPGAPSGH